MKTYRIYRLENKTMNDEVFKFYLPEEDDDMKTVLKRRVQRLRELHDLKKQGYVITAEILADKEEYLNARLSSAVSEYCELDKQERTLRLFKHRYSPEVYIKTLELILDSKRVEVKRVVSIVRRLNREDFDVNNGIALMLYDQYIKEIV